MKEGRGGGADEKVGEGGGVQIFPQRGAFANVPLGGAETKKSGFLLF